MDKKNILIVSRRFYPEISPRSIRTTELVKEFAKQGHDVTLITVKNDNDYVPFEKKYGVTIKTMGMPVLPKINCTNGRKLWLISKRILRRILLQLFEYPAIELMFRVKLALRKEKHYDLLISIAAPHPIHWGVAWCRSQKNQIATTWVADCGDPYMGAVANSFKNFFYFKYVEKWFCRKADYITVPIQGAIGGYYPEFRHKIKVIPQGFNFDEIEENRAVYKPHKVPTFAYAGLFINGSRDPRNLLDYLVNQDRDFKFLIYAKIKETVKPYLEKAKGRIEIRDYIPRAELLKVLSGMDFLVNINNATDIQKPSKLIDYYLAGRPILSLDSGQVDTEIIKQFFERDYRAQLKYENMERYRIEQVTLQFLELLCTPKTFKP